MSSTTGSHEEGHTAPSAATGSDDAEAAASVSDPVRAEAGAQQAGSDERPAPAEQAGSQERPAPAEQAGSQERPAPAEPAGAAAAAAPAGGVAQPGPLAHARALSLASGDVWTTVGQVFGAVAASAGFVYLIGGMVMWLRFRQADLPADQAVSLMSRSQLLVVGLRLMILPALATGALAWWFASRTSPVTVQAEAGGSWPARARARVRAASKWRLGLIVGGAVLLVIFAFMLPATWASLSWLAAAVLVIGFRLRQVRKPRGNLDPRLTLAVVAVVAAGIVSLARQLDQPVQLLSARVTLDSGPPRTGVLVADNGDDVFIGDTVEHTIVGLPRSHVTSVTAGPPEERAPAPSLLARLLGGNDYAITPFEWWCNGERYTWGELGDLCRTQLVLVDASRVLDGARPSYAPVKVRCPPRATEGCIGSLRLVSRKLWRGGPASIPKHVVIGPVALHTAEARRGDMIPPGKTGYVCPQVPASTRGLLRNVAAEGDDKPTPTVEFQLIVTSDAAGHDVVRRTNYALTIPPPGEAFRDRQSDCSTLHAS